MFGISRRSIYALSNRIRGKNPEKIPEKKYVFNFKKINKSPFDAQLNDTHHDTCLSNGSFTMALKKSNCIAWVKIPDREFQDSVIEAKIRLDSCGGYGAAGFLLRVSDNDTYNMAIVSSKGYFRLDAVKNGSPRTMIAWTEIPEFDGVNINLSIISYVNCIILVINGKWAVEVNDYTAGAPAQGQLGFTLVSYPAGNEQETDSEDREEGYVFMAHLDYLSIDTRLKAIGEKYKKWTDDSNINADSRLRLAETFAVTGDSEKALDQLARAWKRRDEAIRSVATAFAEVRTRKELLLAARMTFRLQKYADAEKYINAFFEQIDSNLVNLASSNLKNSAEVKEALTEKIKILNELDKFEELKDFILKYNEIIRKDIVFFTLAARCFWELKEYEISAGAWISAIEISASETGAENSHDISNRGVYAANAASALEHAGKKDEALERYLEAGKIFLNLDNASELEVMMPKLALLGEKNWEARSLVGKWFFSIEDYDRGERELIAAEKLRCALRPRPKADPAVYYLLGLINNIRGKNKSAIRMIEKAVKNAPDYELFRTKLAEIKAAAV